MLTSTNSPLMEFNNSSGDIQAEAGSRRVFFFGLITSIPTLEDSSEIGITQRNTIVLKGNLYRLFTRKESSAYCYSGTFVRIFDRIFKDIAKNLTDKRFHRQNGWGRFEVYRIHADLNFILP